MKVFEILAILKTLKFRDKWHKGILTYAVEMMEKLCNGDQEGVTKDTEYSEISIGHVTHHCDGYKFKASDRTKDAKDIVRRACYGAMFLVSNEDICNRLYTKRDKACNREYERAMDCQIGAVWEALELIKLVASGADKKTIQKYV